MKSKLRSHVSEVDKHSYTNSMTIEIGDYDMRAIKQRRVKRLWYGTFTHVN